MRAERQDTTSSLCIHFIYQERIKRNSAQPWGTALVIREGPGVRHQPGPERIFSHDYPSPFPPLPTPLLKFNLHELGVN